MILLFFSFVLSVFITLALMKCVPYFIVTRRPLINDDSFYLYPYGSFLRSIVLPYLAKLYTHQNTTYIKWYYVSFIRKFNKLFSPSIHNHKNCKTGYVFISPDDPQSFILLQCLLILYNKYPNLILKLIVIKSGSKTWATSDNLNCEWVLNDAIQFANLYSNDNFNIIKPNNTIGISRKKQWKDKLDYTTYILISIQDQNNKDLLNGSLYATLNMLKDSIKAMRNIWDESNSDFKQDVNYRKFNDSIVTILENNKKILINCGYYGPGVVEIEGEFYQPNRLHHLEKRLQDDYQNKPEFIFNKELDKLNKHSILSCNSNNNNSNDESDIVRLYYSFRSPYSQLAVMRLNKICKHYGVKLDIRVMMPMVMRGLHVSTAKAMFILQDCAREARIYGLTFGYCCDPIKPDGIPVKRALDAFVIAKKYNKEIEYIESFAEFVWGKGYDAGTDYGLKCIIDKCGLPWNEVQNCLGDPEIENIWTEMTLNNRKDISDQGLWGVPCIAYKDLFLWGQDKIWAIEKALELDSFKEKQKIIVKYNDKHVAFVEEKEENVVIINSKKKKSSKNKNKKNN